MKNRLNITKDSSKRTGWVNFTMNLEGKALKGFAKIYGEPTEGYGIDDGRVSKLYIEEIETRKALLEFDRGHSDIRHINDETCSAIAAELERRIN